MGTRLYDLGPDERRRIREFYAWVKERAAWTNASGWQSDAADALSHLEDDLVMRFPELKEEAKP